MKWIAVILVMLNLIVFLFMKSYPTTVQPVSEDEYETISASAMSVLPPHRQPNKEAAVATKVLNADLVEDDLAQLKVDDRGQVLMARESQQSADVPEARPAMTAAEPSSTANAGTAPKVSSAPVLQPLDRRSTPAAVAKAPAKAESPKVAPKPKPKPVSVVAKPATNAAAEKLCYRVGPFLNQNELASVRRKLESASILHTVEEKTPRGNIKAVRVYMGAFPSAEALNAQKARLSKMKIEHFVIVLNGEQLIQLGYFSEPGRAKNYQKELKAKNLAVKTATIYRDTRIESWLNLRSVSVSDMDALRLPSGARKQKKACR